jgi:phosphate/sulfate permease
MIMNRKIAVALATLALTAGAAIAGTNVSDKTVKDAIRYNQIVSTGGVWDAR